MKITVELTDTLEVKTSTDTNIQYKTMINMLMTAALSTMNAVMSQAKKDHLPYKKKQELKEYLFDEFNVAASTLLATFAPDIELRPDITEEAILKAELEIANDKMSKL